jgi:NitT/TauT family transport system substrate-binding protein
MAGLGLSGAGLALLAGCGNRSLPIGPFAAATPADATKIRLGQIASICQAPLFLAAARLQAEGIEAEYVLMPTPVAAHDALSAGSIDIMLGLGISSLIRVDQGEPIVILAGGHVGCYELFGANAVKTLTDLKGKTVAVPTLGAPQQDYISSMLAYVGLDPRADVNWVAHPFGETMDQLATGQVDAFLGFPPQPQELRAKGIGHVVINTMMDKPWSEHFCCMVPANQAFVQQHPVAAKQALRAILQAIDDCVLEPARVARLLVNEGCADNYDYALEALQEIPFGKWREIDPEDTLRFYALRLHEVGMIKGDPNTLISRAADWRILDELKKEPKT